MLTHHKTDCFEQLAINAIGPRHVADCFEQLATSAIDPHHFNEHLFFDPFSHFL